MGNQKGFVPILIIILIAVTAIGAYTYYMNSRHPIKLHAVYNYSPLIYSPSTIHKGKVDTPVDEFNEIEASPAVQTGTSPEGWKIYTNSIDGYSLLYPENWHILACSNGLYEGNIHFSSKPVEDKKCVAENMDEAVQPNLSIFASYDGSIEEQFEMARKDMGFIIEFIEKSTEINSKNYQQMLMKLKILPPWAIPNTTAVTTFVEVPEREEIIHIGLVGLDDDSENANIYRQMISSIKILDTPKPTNYPRL